MTDEEERKNIDYRVRLLKREMEAGKVKFAPGVGDSMSESLARIRVGADGLVDPTTVGGDVRALTLILVHEENQRELRESIPLREIQELYFRGLTDYFGELYEIQQKQGVSPEAVATWVAQQDQLLDANYDQLRGFLEGVRRFWQSAQDPLDAHIHALSGNQAVFSGSLYPGGSIDPIASASLYFDTLLIPDPLLKLTGLLNTTNRQDLLRQAIVCGLETIKYRQLALAEVSPPLAIVVPARWALEDTYRNLTFAAAEKDALLHLKHTFGQSFDSVEDARAYLRRYSNAGDPVAAVARKELLLFSTEWEDNPATQIENYVSEYRSTGLPLDGPGDAVVGNAISRMGQANDAVSSGVWLRALPVIQAPTSWQWFAWKLAYDADQWPLDNRTGLHVSHALTGPGGSDLEWLGQLPHSTVLELRRAGALDELQGVLSKGVRDISSTTPAAFSETAALVRQNLEDAFVKYQADIRQARRAFGSWAATQLAPFLVTGGVGFAAAMTNSPVYAVFATAASMTGVVPTAKDVVQGHDELSQRLAAICSTPIGMLFSARKQLAK